MSNSNHFLIWTNLPAAQAYAAAANAWWSANVEPGGAATNIFTDAFGQPVTAYLGPPVVFDFGNGLEELQEPEGFEALRADAVLHTTWVPPEEEDDEG